MLTDHVRWVLRNARRHAGDPALRSAAGFAAGGGVQPAVHRSQVGRWERGRAELTRDIVRRYETVLGLPEGQLLCTIDFLSRDREPIRSSATLPARSAPTVEAAGELLERAFGIDRMTGHDWDQLSNALGMLPNALIREADWEHLLTRCTREMAVAVGLDFALRSEAVARLAGHARSGPVIARMARAVLTNPTEQVYSDVVGLAQYSDHPDTVAVLLEQLRTPTNHDSLRAALYALATSIRGDRVAPEVRNEAARLAIAHVRDPARPFRVQRAAANLIRVLDLPQAGRLATGLRADDRVFAASILLEGRALGAQAVLEAQARVQAFLTAELGHDEDEPVFRKILTTAISTSDDEARSNALTVLMLAPQGRVVGSAYAAELTRARAAGNRVVVHECLLVLSYLTQPADLDRLVEILCSPDEDPAVTMETAIAAGNCLVADDPLVRRRLTHVMERARDTVAGRGDATAEAVRQRLRGFAYVLGMRGRFDLDAELAAAVEPGGPHAALCLGVIDWWRSLPEWIRPAPPAPVECARRP